MALIKFRGVRSPKMWKVYRKGGDDNPRVDEPVETTPGALLGMIVFRKRVPSVCVTKGTR